MRTEASHELYAETKLRALRPKHIKRIAKALAPPWELEDSGWKKCAAHSA